MKSLLTYQRVLNPLILSIRCAQSRVKASLTVGKVWPAGCQDSTFSSKERTVHHGPARNRLGSPRIMRIKGLTSPLWLSFAAASLVALPALNANAQNAPVNPIPATPAQTATARTAGEAAPPGGDRSQAYYHSALTHIYYEDSLASAPPELMP